MDHKQFDNLTRSVASGAGTRRRALRAFGGVLLAGALGRVATQVGLAEGKPRKTHAKKRNKKKTNPKGAQDIPLCRIDCEASDRKCCPDGSCVLIGDCCPGMKRCGVTSCIPEDQCCPGDDSAGCELCEVEVCINGEWVCQPTEECGPRCGDGYCPDDMSCHHGGMCCRPRRPEEGPGYVCECASGYSSGCNGQCCKSCCYPDCCENL